MFLGELWTIVCPTLLKDQKIEGEHYSIQNLGAFETPDFVDVACGNCTPYLCNHLRLDLLRAGERRDPREGTDVSRHKFGPHHRIFICKAVGMTTVYSVAFHQHMSRSSKREFVV